MDLNFEIIGKKGKGKNKINKQKEEQEKEKETKNKLKTNRKKLLIKYTRKEKILHVPQQPLHVFLFLGFLLDLCEKNNISKVTYYSHKK
jgi:hypothetical protein